MDYGCGTGIHSIHIAKCGGFVKGIDISDVAIEIGKMRAGKERVAHRCKFVVGDAEETKFPANSFDFVFNSGTLSCLDLDKALLEVCRVLKPDGVFLGIDTLGHNPILNVNRYLKYRRCERTKQTLHHILHMSDLKRFQSYFSKTKFIYFDLMTLLAIPLEKLHKVYPRVLKLLENIDGLLLRSFLKRYAFKVVFVLSQPNKDMRYERVDC